VLKHPLITEKDMKKMEDENTMVYIVDSKATKPQIKKAFEKIHSVTVKKVNVINITSIEDPQQLPGKEESLHQTQWRIRCT
jgi:ribosomal protein L23